MTTEAGLQTELECLLDNFFSGTSTNDEKLQINKVLEDFSQQQGVWRYCVYFIQHSTNHHILMYSLNVIENLVTRMWSTLSPAEHSELRHFLMQHVITHHTTMLPFIKNKLIKVIVLTGRSDWPHEYPEFFSHILQLVRSPETSPLGLIFLMTASEELVNTSCDFLTSQRKEELSQLMQQEVSTILSVLMRILEAIAEKQRHSVTPTPPPSPNVSPIKQVYTAGSPVTQSHSLQSSPFGTPPPSLGTPLRTRLSAPLLGVPLKSSPPVPGNAPYAPLDSLSEEICVLALKCLAHLFSWMPLSSLITPVILETIFHFASLGCDSVVDATEHFGNLGSLAMDCINELLVKNCVPREFEAFLMKLFEKSFLLLQRLTSETERGISCDFSKLDDRFLAKCSDFFFWFVSSHLKRVEFNPHFPVLEFLGLFYKYTFKQPGEDSFCVCLDTWAVFLDHLILMSSDSYGRQSPPSGNHYERYKGVLVSMMESVLHKALLHYNIDDLREIDDDAIDDDNETEWQSFLRQCLEFIGKVAELFPGEAFQLLLPLLESYSQVYLSLGQLVSQQGNIRTLVISEGSECEKLHAVLKDLTSILQALGRLAEHFVGDRFHSRLNEAQLLVKRFCMLAEYSTNTVLFNVVSPVPEILDHDFIELHAQILGTLQAFTHWFSQFYLDSLRQQDHTHHQTTLLPLVSALVNSSLPLITRDIPEKITLVACQLLLSLATTVRPRFLPSMAIVQDLMRKVPQGDLVQLPQKAYFMVHRALTHMLVLPWPETNDSQQQWEERSLELSRLISGSTVIFQQLEQTAGWTQNTQLQQRAKPEIKRALVLLEDLVSSVAHEHSKSKAALFKSISPCIDFTISLFPAYLHQPDVLDLLMAFFLSLFGSLKTQVGRTLTERTTQTFMNLLTREHLQEALDRDGSPGSKVVEKFLKILQLLVQDPANAGKEVLPSVVSFVMNQIYPIVAEKTAPDIKLALYELLYQLLLNNWRYFFSGTVLLHMDSDESNGDPTVETEFFRIMESFGQSLLEPDITVFKQNLQALESLNSKHKLYSKVQFRNNMLYPFLQLLLQVLVQKSHDLLQEEVCLCAYSMASVDFNVYHDNFLPKYMEDLQGLTHEQKSKLVKSYRVLEDLPSFIQNLRQFVSDLRYFLVMNTTLPADSVKLS